MLYLIEYESSRWANASHYCVVEADSPEHAKDLASEYMEEHMLELFFDDDIELRAEEGDDATTDCSYSVMSVEEFGSQHEYWKYFKDPEQSQFFPLVGR